MMRAYVSFDRRQALTYVAALFSPYLSSLTVIVMVLAVQTTRLRAECCMSSTVSAGIDSAMLRRRLSSSVFCWAPCTST